MQKGPTMKEIQQRPFPDYSTINEAYEHFRLVRILFKYTGVPRDYLEHMRKQVEKFSTKLAGTSNKRVKEMKDILSVFKKSFIKKVVKQGQTDEDFNLALYTTKTNDGVQVGDYFIKIYNTKESSRKLYSIHNKQNKTLIKDLLLYEVAFMLVHSFHRKNDFGDQPVEEILEQHAEYKKIILNYDTQKSKLLSTSPEDSEYNYYKNMVSGLKRSLNQVYRGINSKYSGLIKAKKTK